MSTSSFTPLHDRRVTYRFLVGFLGLMLLMYPATRAPDYDGALFSQREDIAYVLCVASAFLGAHGMAAVLRRRSLINMVWLVAALSLVVGRVFTLVLYDHTWGIFSTGSCVASGRDGGPLCAAAMPFIEYRDEHILLVSAIFCVKVCVDVVQYLLYWTPARRAAQSDAEPSTS